MSQKMYMTDEEIAASYRQAKNKEGQVQVLADLNVVSRGEMAQKLRDLGLMDQPARKRGRPKKEVQFVKKDSPANYWEKQGFEVVGPADQEQKNAEPEKKEEENAAKPTESTAGMTIQQIAELFGNLSKQRADELVYVGEKTIKAVVVTLRYDGNGDPPGLLARMETG